MSICTLQAFQRFDYYYYYCYHYLGIRIVRILYHILSIYQQNQTGFWPPYQWKKRLFFFFFWTTFFLHSSNWTLKIGNRTFSWVISKFLSVTWNFFIWTFSISSNLNIPRYHPKKKVTSSTDKQGIKISRSHFFSFRVATRKIFGCCRCFRFTPNLTICDDSITWMYTSMFIYNLYIYVYYVRLTHCNYYSFDLFLWKVAWFRRKIQLKTNLIEIEWIKS